MYKMIAVLMFGVSAIFFCGALWAVYEVLFEGGFKQWLLVPIVIVAVCLAIGLPLLIGGLSVWKKSE